MIIAKKSLGQNFLIDKNIIKKILSLVKIENSNVIEIGSGKGALTNEILKKEPKSLSIIEKDDSLINELTSKFSNVKNVNIYKADILKFKIEKIQKKNSIIMGNLPYNISSQILIKFLKQEKWPPKFKDLVFMFQKELGNKIINTYPSPNYGRLSIIANYRLNIVKKFLVSPNSFYPKPKVTSMVIHFQPKINNLIKIKNTNSLEKITNILFSNKRKMINKNILKILNEDMIKKILGNKIYLRPAEIKPEIFYKIAKYYEES